jgi:hypothetical protein
MVLGAKSAYYLTGKLAGCPKAEFSTKKHLKKRKIWWFIFKEI